MLRLKRWDAIISNPLLQRDPILPQFTNSVISEWTLLMS